MPQCGVQGRWPLHSSANQVLLRQDETGGLSRSARNEAAHQKAWIRTALHDFAQPLTALECGLFLSTLSPEQGADELRQVIDEAMSQCQRMLVCFRAIQERLG